MSSKPDKKRLTTPDPSEVILKEVQAAPQRFPDRLRRNRHPLTGLLTSVLVHTFLLVLLLLVVFRSPVKDRGLRILADVRAEHESLNEQPSEREQNSVKIELPVENQSPLEAEQTDLTKFDETALKMSENQVVKPEVAVEKENPTAEENNSNGQPAMTMPTGGGLAGRDPTARGALASARGGSQASEDAVEEGLRWILAHQSADGSWALHHCKSAGCKCGNEGERESKTAATGLSLLALLGAGYTHQAGPHQAAVQRGLNHLTKNMRSNGSWLGDSDKMYAHAIATIALAEAFQMTGDKSLAPFVEKARLYCVNAQNKSDSKRKGSWGYSAGSPGDITVSGWHLMALKSCQNAGLPTEAETWKLTEKFVDSLWTSEGSFGYDDPRKVTSATTAIGLFAKMHLGMHRESPVLAMGGDILAQRGPSDTDIYYNYYATQVMYHRQGEDWAAWNKKMRDFLIARQITGRGHDSGSWYFEDRYGKVGGRLYTTALAVLTLEVYYRYLPMYDELVLGAERMDSGASGLQR